MEWKEVEVDWTGLNRIEWNWSELCTLLWSREMDDYAGSNRTIDIVPTLHMDVHHILAHSRGACVYMPPHSDHHDVRPR